MYVYIFIHDGRMYLFILLSKLQNKALITKQSVIKL